jgi:hypothetical protein
MKLALTTRRRQLAAAAAALLLASGLAGAEGAPTDKHEVPAFVLNRVDLVLDAGTAERPSETR